MYKVLAAALFGVVGVGSGAAQGGQVYTDTGAPGPASNGAVTLRTGGVKNPNQGILDLIPGPNISLIPNSNGGVIIAAQAGSSTGGINFRGAYNGTFTYVKNDLVIYNGASYIALNTSTGQLPTTAGIWQLFTPSANNLVSSVAGKLGDVVITATDVSGLAAVARTGSFADLTNKPNIPNISTSAGLKKGDGTNIVNAVAGTDYQLPLSGDCTSANDGTVTCTKVSGQTLSPAAFSGSLADLTGNLSASRTPAYIGDVSKAAGSALVSVTGVNGSGIPKTNRIQKANNAGQFTDALSADVISTLGFNPENVSNRGVTYAPLDLGAKVPLTNLPQATNTAGGYLSAADWVAFNSKLNSSQFNQSGVLSALNAPATGTTFLRNDGSWVAVTSGSGTGGGVTPGTSLALPYYSTDGTTVNGDNRFRRTQNGALLTLNTQSSNADNVFTGSGGGSLVGFAHTHVDNGIGLDYGNGAGAVDTWHVTKALEIENVCASAGICQSVSLIHKRLGKAGDNSTLSVYDEQAPGGMQDTSAEANKGLAWYSTPIYNYVGTVTTGGTGSKAVIATQVGGCHMTNGNKSGCGGAGGHVINESKGLGTLHITAVDSPRQLFTSTETFTPSVYAGLTSDAIPGATTFGAGTYSGQITGLTNGTPAASGNACVTAYNSVGAQELQYSLSGTAINLTGITYPLSTSVRIYFNACQYVDAAADTAAQHNQRSTYTLAGHPTANTSDIAVSWTGHRTQALLGTHFAEGTANNVLNVWPGAFALGAPGSATNNENLVGPWAFATNSVQWDNGDRIVGTWNPIGQFNQRFFQCEFGEPIYPRAGINGCQTDIVGDNIPYVWNVGLSNDTTIGDIQTTRHVFSLNPNVTGRYRTLDWMEQAPEDAMLYLTGCKFGDTSPNCTNSTPTKLFMALKNNSGNSGGVDFSFDFKTGDFLFNQTANVRVPTGKMDAVSFIAGAVPTQYQTGYPTLPNGGFALLHTRWNNGSTTYLAQTAIDPEGYFPGVDGTNDWCDGFTQSGEAQLNASCTQGRWSKTLHAASYIEGAGVFARYHAPLVAPTVAYVGTASAAVQHTYVLGAVLPNGAFTALSKLNNRSVNTVATLDPTSNYVNVTMPAAAGLADYPTGTRYALWRYDNNSPTTNVRYIGAYAAAAVAKDIDAGVSYPSVPTGYATADLGGYKVNTRQGLYVFANDLGTTIDTSLTRTAASTFALGNGTFGDRSGTLQLGYLSLGSIGVPATPTLGTLYVNPSTSKLGFCNGTTCADVTAATGGSTPSGPTITADTSGDLVFNNQTSVTYTWAGTYANNAQPRVSGIVYKFNHNGNDGYVSAESNTSFTITFAAPVTGTLTFHTDPRS